MLHCFCGGNPPRFNLLPFHTGIRFPLPPFAGLAGSNGSPARPRQRFALQALTGWWKKHVFILCLNIFKISKEINECPIDFLPDAEFYSLLLCFRSRWVAQMTHRPPAVPTRMPAVAAVSFPSLWVPPAVPADSGYVTRMTSTKIQFPARKIRLMRAVAVPFSTPAK